jgi:hypothetical protein
MTGCVRSMSDPSGQWRLEPFIAIWGRRDQGGIRSRTSRRWHEVREGSLEPNLDRVAHANDFVRSRCCSGRLTTLLFDDKLYSYCPGDFCSIRAGAMHEEHTESDGVLCFRAVIGRSRSGPIAGVAGRT